MNSVIGPPSPIASTSRIPNMSRSVESSRLQPRNRKTAPPQIGEHLQLENVERRIAALRKAAGLRAVRCNGRLEQPPRVPPLKLPRGQTREPCHLARGVVLLEPHNPNRSGRTSSSSGRSCTVHDEVGYQHCRQRSQQHAVSIVAVA